MIYDYDIDTPVSCNYTITILASNPLTKLIPLEADSCSVKQEIFHLY
jgi:hypothetical protein